MVYFYAAPVVDFYSAVDNVVEVIAKEGANDLAKTAETAGWMVYSLLNHLSVFVPRVYFQGGVPVALQEMPI